MTSAHTARDVRIFMKECRSLAAAGFDVMYIVPGAETCMVDNVRIIGVDVKKGSRLKRMLFTTRKVYKTAKSSGAGIFHFHDPELMIAGLLLKWSGKKVIYDVHEDIVKQILSKEYINKGFRKIVAYVIRNTERFIARRMDYCLTATESIRLKFVNLKAKTEAIFNYPLPEELPGEIVWANRKQQVCYTGVITSQRGLNTVLSAFEEDALKDIKLNLAGDASPETFLDELKASSGWKNVNFHGLVGRKEMYSILSDSRAGLVPFMPEPNHIEALPNKIFEYMSAGLPVIASDFPMWKELIEGNGVGICVEPGRTDLLAKAINELCNDDEKARQMGDKGRRLVLEKYNWRSEEIKLVQIYSDLLEL